MTSEVHRTDSLRSGAVGKLRISSFVVAIVVAIAYIYTQPDRHWDQLEGSTEASCLTVNRPQLAPACLAASPSYEKQRGSTPIWHAPASITSTRAAVGPGSSGKTGCATAG